MKKQLTETIIGLIVVLIAVFFAGYAFLTVGMNKNTSGYYLYAKFNKISGIVNGTDIRIAGIKIGSVNEIRLDPETYMAEVKFQLSKSIQIPVDSSMKVVTDGLLGQAHLAIEPGGEVDMLKPGEEISYTQGSVDVFELIGKTVFNRAGKKTTE